MQTKISSRHWIVKGIALGALVLLIAGTGYAAYLRYRQMQEELMVRSQRIELLSNSLRWNRDELATAQAEIDRSHRENEDLALNLQAEQSKNSQFEAQIREISGAVGTLTKLSQTDPELLRKYSKVYFLSENYLPAKLSAIDPAHLYDSAKPQQINAQTAPFLQALLGDAAAAGAKLQVVSAYRSFTDQASVKSTYKMLYGTGANQFSADQGYSEHQLGTTVDLTSPGLSGLSVRFENTTSSKWLAGNAYRYGFVLSYPKKNAYYQYEPWHWRFVGRTLAQKLHDENRYFYDLTQREINIYLVTLFD